ncbi:conserved hypothetical protein [uncultured Microbacterium sp.]|uniref:Thioesterase n=1 Tax=uncultured Microbacterium sp. TaxID=191216 RepID=A0A1Y5P894_9MICO|nr:conserved hypothetical protein [uncultured Microbacterium sp.]
MTAYDPKVTPYFERLGQQRFRATDSVQGAWNTTEQHIAPALGLLAHTVERDHTSRHDTPFQLARACYDILGTIPIADVDIEIRVLRPGRTIELVEATLSHNGRAAVVLRAWMLATRDTTTLAGTTPPPMPPRHDLKAWSATAIWPGLFVTTIDIRRREHHPGRAEFWLRPRVPLLAGEDVSPTARLLGVIDIANGITPRTSPREVAFPNLDLTAHLTRAPEGDWIGCSTTVTFGPDGFGTTHTALHDQAGYLGTSVQTLTVRP